MKKLKGMAIAVSLAPLMLLTACGTQNSSGTSNGGGGSSSGGTSSGGTITIGAITPMTGSSAKMGLDMNNAIKMEVKQINANGGLLGKQVKVDYEDGACDPTTATSAANKLVAKNVVAVVGGYCSGSTLPATGVLHQAGIPWVLTAANSEKIPQEGYNDIFLLNSTAPAQAKTAADYMTQSLHGKRIAIINDKSAYSVDLATRTKQDLIKDGAQVIAFDAVDPNENDFSAELTKLKSLKPDVTYWTGYYAAGGLMLKQFKQLGVPGAFGVGDGSNDPTMVKIAGEQNAQGYFTTTSPTPQFQASAKQWVTKYQSEFNAAPGPYSALTYDGTRLLADAITRANSTKSADIITALAATNGFQSFGGPVSFKKDGEPSKSNFIVLVYKNGKYQVAAK